MQSKDRRKLFFSLLLVGITFLTFANTLKNGFVWDDVKIISSEIKYIENHGFFKGGGIYWRPFVTLSFLWDSILWQDNPMGFHLTNIVFHILASLLVFLLFVEILRKRTMYNTELAFLSAMLFALHPIHTESVSWIAGRTDCVATFFFLLSFLSYIYAVERNEKAGFLLSPLFFFLSILSKEIGFTLVPVVFLYEFLINRDRGTGFLPRKKRLEKKRRERVVILFVGYIIVFLLYLFLRGNPTPYIAKYAERPYLSFELEKPDSLHIILQFVNALGLYVKKLFLPIGLNNFIDRVPSSLPFTVYSIFTIVVIFSSFVILLRKKERVIAFIVLFFILTLLPSWLLSIIRIPATPVAERFLYLPSVPFSLFVTLILFRVVPILKLRKKTPLNSLFIVYIPIFFILSFLTYSRNNTWYDNITIWRDAINKGSRSGVALNEYGRALLNNGDWRLARSIFKRSLQTEINNIPTARSVVYYNIALTFSSEGGVDSALHYLQRSIEANPRDPKPYLNIGRLYLDISLKNKINIEYLKTALRYFKKTIELNRKFREAYLLSGVAYFYLDSINLSKREFERIVRKWPASPESQEAINWLKYIKQKESSK